MKQVIIAGVALLISGMGYAQCSGSLEGHLEKGFVLNVQSSIQEMAVNDVFEAVVILYPGVRYTVKIVKGEGTENIRFEVFEKGEVIAEEGKELPHQEKKILIDTEDEPDGEFYLTTDQVRKIWIRIEPEKRNVVKTVCRGVVILEKEM